MNNHDLAAGDDLAAILDIPLFLQRPPRERKMLDPDKYFGAIAPIEKQPDLPIESPPTLEQLLETIRLLIAKRDKMTANIDGLKKQAEGMLRKL